MNPSPPSAPPEVKPMAVHLSDILGWVRQGRLRPTRFQRPFRWDRSRVVDLFDSVRKQYPIGTLLLWISPSKRPDRDTLGPLKLPQANGQVLLLIDGQQRVSTLAGVLLHEKLDKKDDLEDPAMWELWFDAEDLSFKHIDPDSAPKTCIRVRDLLDIRAIVKATQALNSATLPREDARDEETLQRVADAWQAAATALTSYRIPVVEFHTDNLQLAVESFTRLNRRGMDISGDEMFSALAEDETKELRLADHIDEALRAVRSAGFGELDRLTVLRLILLNMDLDPFRTDWNRLSKETQDKTRDALEPKARAAQAALLLALKFLRTEAKLSSTRLLPYSGILVGLAAYLGSEPRDLAPEERKRLVDWVWKAAFEGFAEGNPSRATNAWRELRSAGRRGGIATPLPLVAPEARATPFPSRHDLRSARLQTSLWASMTGWDLGDDHLERIGQFINQQGAAAWKRIFRPNREVSDTVHRALFSSPANRVFDFWGFSDFKPSAEPAFPRVLAGCAPDAPDHEGWRRRLQVTPEAYEALKDNEVIPFLRLRQAKMIADERDVMRVLGVTPPDDTEARPAAIDHEGDDSDVFDL